MKFIWFSILAFAGGVFLAIQAAYNTQLGSLTKQPVLAAVAASFTSFILGTLFVILFNKQHTVSSSMIQQVPWYLWFIGGVFSITGISLYFYTIPKLGISKMIALGLCGQLLFSLIAGKFGWFNLPQEPLTSQKIIGMIAMLLGIFLINTK